MILDAASCSVPCPAAPDGSCWCKARYFSRPHERRLATYVAHHIISSDAPLRQLSRSNEQEPRMVNGEVSVRFAR
jgi:hypothetical protein